MKPLINETKIAIVGGGPGGLSLARLLQMREANVTVYERDKDRHARLLGSSLDLHENTGQQVIEAAGLEEKFNELCRPGDAIKILDKNGNILLEADPDTITEGRPEIDRPQLRGLLLDSLREGTVVWDKQFVTLEKQANGHFTLIFNDGLTTTADLVIGCDGVHSKIRPLITPIKPHYSGTTVIEGEIKHPETKCVDMYRLLNHGSLFILGDSKALLMQQKGDGTITFYATSKMTEHALQESGIDFADNPAVSDFLKRQYAGWKPLYYSLFDAASRFTPRLMFAIDATQNWDTQPNLTIIGDAAHVMPPFAGVGVNMAMMDALELADCLTSDTYQTITEAIHAYEQQMLKRTAEAQEKTKHSEDLFHSPTAIEDLLKRIESEGKDPQK